MILSVAAVFVMTVTLTPLIAAWARRRDLLDVPNHRSSHVVATPRTGGAAFVPAVLIGVAILHATGMIETNVLIVVGAALAVGVVGFIDDLHSLPAAGRFLFQLIVALLLVQTLGSPAFPFALHGPIAAGLTVIWIAALTNAYNFMDGIDGIAGAHAVVAGIGWALIGVLIDSQQVTALGLVAAAAASGFLVYNWQPARVFMGDAGSAFLGFLFGAIPLLITAERAEQPMVSAWLLAWPFLFDTALTLIRRAHRRENVLLAHRSHLYQRLTATGLTHWRVSLLYSALSAIGGTAAIALAAGRSVVATIFAIAVVASALGLWQYVVAREALRRPPSHPTESVTV
ncbi:glycosyltransferase family 4 protein [soil metagenome]